MAIVAGFSAIQRTGVSTGKPSAGGGEIRRFKPAPGKGFLAGTYPTGITSVEGVPTPATVRVHYRPVSGAPGDGSLVAEVQSAVDGTWRVDGLDPALKFDVICRKEGYNDMILANISPLPNTP